MRSRPPHLPTLVSALLIALACRPAAAEPAALSWSDYRLGQFISSRGQAPGDILELDNNGNILLACRGGCSLESLAAAGVPALASQLELLRGWALLVEEGNGLRTGIPILDRTATELLEKRAAELAASLAESAGADVAELVAALEAEGFRSHAWAVVFSYILDGEVWEFFDELSLIGRRNVSRRGAPWGGEAWAYVASREREPRTSTLRRDTVTVKLSWSEALRPFVASLLTGPAGLRELFTEFLEKGQPESPEVTAKLMEYGILGPERQLTVPMIEEDLDDPLYQLCARLTTEVAEGVVADLDRAALVGELGLESESQALVIAYHEVMWRLMERLVENGAIELPAALADPESALPADVGRLVVMARFPQESPAAGGQDEE